MSRHVRSRSLIRSVICLLPWIIGCAGGKPPPASFSSLPVSSLSPQELGARVNHDAAAVTSLQGKLELGMRVPPDDTFKRCRGVIASRSPWSGTESPGLFLEGYRQLIPTLFTLVSDGQDFWLHVPYDNVAYNGPIDGPHPARHGQEIRLDVNDLFRALFVQPIDPADSVDVSEEGADYVLAIFRDGQLRRRLWIERRAFTVPREVYYGPHADVRLQIDRDAYADVSGSLFPMRLVLRDPTSSSMVLLDFSSVTLHPEKLTDRVFQPKIPPDTVVRRTDLREAQR